MKRGGLALVKTLLCFANEAVANIDLLCTLSINALCLVDNDFFYQLMDDHPVEFLYVNIFLNQFHKLIDARALLFGLDYSNICAATELTA